VIGFLRGLVLSAPRECRGMMTPEIEAELSAKESSALSAIQEHRITAHLPDDTCVRRERRTDWERNSMKIDDDYLQADEAGKDLLDYARKYIGENVRLVDARKSRIGTIRDTHLEYGREGDFEHCERPTDEYVKAIRALIEYGS
jgi:hypothetical protein